MAAKKNWIPARKSHLRFYDNIPLYYRSPSGNIILYKPAGMSISDQSLQRKYSIDEFFIHPDNRLESIDAAQKGFSKDLIEQIQTKDAGKLKDSLVDLVEETLAAPRAGGISSIPKTVNALVNNFSEKPSVIKNFTKISFSDYTTALHSVNVMALTISYCYFIGLSETETQEMGLAALLHDIGKTEIPSNILKASRRLSDNEFSIVKSHTTKGLDILNLYNEPEIINAAAGAIEHHERLDGSGYPNGIINISYIGRVLAIVDCYEAVTNDDRPYRTAMAPMEALEIIKKDVDSGKLDKEIFKDFAYSLASRKTK
ncbi:MAG: HD domain-containing protein [Spirochaetales bacterium]|nr:HD domain-containing protein [Spirochaetales bacterium]